MINVALDVQCSEARRAYPLCLRRGPAMLLAPGVSRILPQEININRYRVIVVPADTEVAGRYNLIGVSEIVGKVGLAVAVKIARENHRSAGAEPVTLSRDWYRDRQTLLDETEDMLRWGRGRRTHRPVDVRRDLVILIENVGDIVNPVAVEISAHKLRIAPKPGSGLTVDRPVVL